MPRRRTIVHCMSQYVCDGRDAELHEGLVIEIAKASSSIEVAIPKETMHAVAAVAAEARH